MALVQTLPANQLNIAQLDASTFLLWARAHQGGGGKISLTINGMDYPVHAHHIAISDATYVLGFITHDTLAHDTAATLALHQGGLPMAGHAGAARTHSAMQRLQQLFLSMRSSEQFALFAWMLSSAGMQAGFGASAGFRQACLQLKDLMAQTPNFNVTHSFWLSPNFLYFEIESPDIRPSGAIPLAFLSSQDFSVTHSRYLQLSETSYAFIAIFAESNVFHFARQGHCFAVMNNAPVAVQPLLPLNAQGMEYIQFLNEKPHLAKQHVQQLVCNMLLEQCPESIKDDAAGIIDKLQTYLSFSPTHCATANDPFNISFEQVIPLGSEGVFICGWMRDPYRMLESVTVHTALGYTFPLGDHIFRTSRPDVNEAFRASTHGGFEEDTGFVVFTPLPPEISHRIQQAGTRLRALYFTVKLRGGIEYMIQPELHFRDDRAARDMIMKLLPARQVSEAMLMECLGPAAEIMQRQTMEHVAVREIYEMEPQTELPRISLCIPLYKRLDFLKVQFATLANDPAIRECEVIYVLDSPWQEAEVRDFLREYAHLYKLPVKLIVMQENSGYAAASNTAAAHARGEYIVLMNSDVFPATKGWTQRMADFYKGKKGAIGALAPKLLYEDDSLQHAGMFFAKTTYPDWINLHYYKGYPRDYAPADISRPVPAVTGACLMIARNVWDEIGQLSTHYVIGDFEDSDLCLKCTEAGYENWYFAEAELYHPERQSVPLNDSYADSLAWRYNARQHSQRWNKLITQLMQRYGET